MNRIRVKNFGPIKEGYLENDGWLDIKKITLFIGNQGSGKSTIAKLISTLSWIEKAMVKGEKRQDELNTYNRFQKQLKYQRLDNYLRANSEIEFIGKAFTFQFINGAFTARKSSQNGYILPKIMYVPAERNFLSVVDRPDKLKELPLPLFTFLDEYDKARNVFWEGLTLPINKTSFKYDRQNKIAHISESDYDLRLSEASSGFQSTIPLFLVTKYLSEWLNNEEDSSIKENSIEEQRKIDKEVKSIMEDPLLTPEVRQSYLRNLSAKRSPSCFINIVEEPEQNLYPSSQRSILNELVKYANIKEGNRLIMSTHSPYLINYITLAVKAHELAERINISELKDKLNAIVPLQSTINPQDLAIYELNEEFGTITLLGNYEGIPSDNNYLNKLLSQGNQLFDSLLEIEEEL